MASYLTNLCNNGNFATADGDFAQHWSRVLPAYRMAEMPVQPTGTKTGLLLAKVVNDVGSTSHDFPVIEGHVYYYRLWVSTPNVYTKYDISIKNASTNAMVSGLGGNSSFSGKYIAYHFKAASTATNKIVLTITSSRSAAETFTYITNILIIDATETYGAGNEMSIYSAESDIITMGNYWEGSKEIGSTSSSSLPLAVSNLITTDTSSSSQLTISWNNPKTVEQPVDGYRIYQKNLTAGETSSTSSTLKQESYIIDNAIMGDSYTSCTIVNLDRAQNDYSIGVGAYNSRGVGPLTWVNVTKTGGTSGGSEPEVQTVPSTPPNVSAQSGPSVGSITISWSPVPDANVLSEVDGYQVFCTSGTVPNWDGLVYNSKPYVQLNGKSWNSYEWKNLTIGTNYSFLVYAFNEAGASETGTTATATPLYQLPTVPQNFNITKTAYQQLTITWQTPVLTGNPAMTGYKLYRQVKDIDGNIIEYFATPYQTLSSSTTTFVDSNLTVKRTYSYYVVAYSSKGESNKTSQKSIMLVGVPSAPSNFTVGIEDGTYPVLRWNPCLDDGGEIPTRFKIYCDKTAGNNLAATIDGSAYDGVQIGCLPGETYYYKISAVNSAGEGTKASANVTIPSENKDTKILVIGNRITNGSFDGDLGITNWTAEPNTCATIIEAPIGMFVDKSLNVKEGNVFTEFEAMAGHTYLVTCKTKAVTGSIQVKLCNAESYIEKSANSIIDISSTSVLRQFTTAHIYGTNGIRVLINSPANTEGIVDGVMLIDLSNTYGHNAVISVETVPYSSFIQILNGFIGGYWEKAFTITKVI